MKTWMSAVVACAAGVFLIAAPQVQARTVGSGHVISEPRAITGFDAISTQGSIDVDLRQAAQDQVTVEAEDNLVPLVETVLEGRTLKIRFKPGESISHRQAVRVHVAAKAISALTTGGSGDVQVDGLQVPAFKLTLSGSSDASVKGLATDAFELRIAGSSDVTVGGRARQTSLSIAGSGDAHLADLASDDVNISIAGSGDADVTANKSLTVSIAGSGDVRWGGTATAVKLSSAGSGSITKR